MEKWKAIPGFEKTYLISDHGKVKSIRKGIILKTQLINSGYEIVHLRIKGKRTAFTVHRLIAIAFIPNPGNKPQVNHKDCIKTNNFYKNLEWLSAKENMAHASENELLSIHTEIRKSLMKNIGSRFGFDNSQKHLKTAMPLYISPEGGGEPIYFRSARNASIELGLDHKTIIKKLNTGKSYRGYLFQSA